jgi:hypothetical protein
MKPFESWSIVMVGRVGCFECVSKDYKKSGKLKGLAFMKHDGVGGSLYHCREHARAKGCPIVGARLRGIE